MRRPLHAADGGLPAVRGRVGADVGRHAARARLRAGAVQRLLRRGVAEWRRRAPPDITVCFAVDGKLNATDRHFRARGRTSISDATYADDSACFASSWETVKAQWHTYIDVTERFGLTVSIKNANTSSRAATRCLHFLC